MREKRGGKLVYICICSFFEAMKKKNINRFQLDNIRHNFETMFASIIIIVSEYNSYLKINVHTEFIRKKKEKKKKKYLQVLLLM